MKKIAAFMLGAVMLLSVAACQSSKPDYQEPDFRVVQVASKDSYSECQGVCVQVGDIYLKDGKVNLSVVWSNQTKYDVIFGGSYVIERYENGAWVDCAVSDELFFMDIAHELKAGRNQNETYKLTNMYDVSKAGEYRFRTTCSVHTGSDDANKITLWAAFTLNSDIDESQFKTQESVNYDVRYIRTAGYHDGEQFPKVVMIRSVEELSSYYNANKDTFDLARKDKAYSDSTIGFLDACDKYDDEYFEKGYLVFVLLEEGSGSIRHEVTGSTISYDGELAVYIKTITPEAGTCDMAQWHIILEMSNGAAVKDKSNVQVNLDNRLAFDKGTIVTQEVPK